MEEITLTRDEQQYLELMRCLRRTASSGFQADEMRFRKTCLTKATQLNINFEKFEFEHLYYAATLDYIDFVRMLPADWRPASSVLNLIIRTSRTPWYTSYRLLQQSNRFNLEDESVDYFLRHHGFNTDLLDYTQLHLLEVETMKTDLLFDLTLAGNQQAQEELRRRDKLGELCREAMLRGSISCAKMAIIYATGEVEWDTKQLIKDNKIRNISALCSIGGFTDIDDLNTFWKKIEHRQRKVWDLQGIVDVYSKRMSKIPALAKRNYSPAIIAKLFRQDWFRISEQAELSKPSLIERHLLLSEMFELEDVRTCVLRLLYQL